MDSMAKKFTRAQLIWMVDLVVKSALDRVENNLPPEPPGRNEVEKEGMEMYANGAVDAAGMALASIYAHTNPDGDGLGIGDAIDAYGLREIVAVFRQQRGLGRNDYWPKTEEASAKFVDSVLANCYKGKK